MIKRILFTSILAAQFLAIAAIPATHSLRTAQTVTVAENDNDCVPFPQPCGGACGGGCQSV